MKILEGFSLIFPIEVKIFVSFSSVFSIFPIGMKICVVSSPIFLLEGKFPFAFYQFFTGVNIFVSFSSIVPIGVKILVGFSPIFPIRVRMFVRFSPIFPLWWKFSWPFLRFSHWSEHFCRFFFNFVFWSKNFRKLLTNLSIEAKIVMSFYPVFPIFSIAVKMLVGFSQIFSLHSKFS